MYPNHINKEDISVKFIEDLPICEVQNRLLIKNYNTKVITKNFTPKDKHLPPIDT